MIAIARSQPAALAEAFRRHGGAVHTRARRVMSDPNAADEVVQEVMLKLWTNPERFDPERGSLRAFLLTQAHSRAVDAVRSGGARRRREGRSERSASEGYDLESEVCDPPIAERVKCALESLPAAERLAIELAFFGGYTYREVAELLEQPEGTVKSRIRTGLRRLRQLL